MPFVKLDCGIIHSSLWAEDSDTKICWITLLLLADATGFVRAAASAIAREAGISAEVARRALDLFQGPDDESRTPDNQGKRIEKVDGGYRVLNYEKYRERDYTNAERQKRWRESQKSNVTGVTEALPVTTRNTCRSRVQKQKEDKRRPLSLAECVAYGITIGISASDTEAFFDSQESGGWTRGGKALCNWQASLRTWKANSWLPSQKQNGQRQFVKAKEKAPSYQKITPARELTAAEESEAENARRIAREETARFKEKFK